MRIEMGQGSAQVQGVTLKGAVAPPRLAPLVGPDDIGHAVATREDAHRMAVHRHRQQTG